MPAKASSAQRSSALPWFRTALGLAGVAVLVAIVHHVGARVVLDTLRGAIRWLPLLCLFELLLVACETASSYIAFGDLAARIPRATLLRAHVLGHSIGAVAPAPTVVRETIKVTLLSPYVGVAPATAVGFVNQAATLISVGLFSVPCGAAVFALGGASTWFWACGVHAIALVASGVGLQVAARADAGRWLVRRLPRLGPRAAAFRLHASGTGPFAEGPTSALLVGRCIQVAQFGVAALAVGIDANLVRAIASQGVNLVAAAVGVLVPAGLGTTDGAFTLAAELLGTTVARATSLALLMRCTQLIWIALGSLAALPAPRRGR
jgi:hypothetical protein